MSGCIEAACENCANIEVGERRNQIAAITAGFLFFAGWWFAIDASATNYENTKDIFHICGVFASISMFMVNSISNGQLRGEEFGDYTGGCLGVMGSRIWFFFGFLMGFGSLIGAAWILFGEYLFGNPEHSNFNPKSMYPGVAFFLQNLFIFFSSVVYKFGRSEDQWS